MSPETTSPLCQDCGTWVVVDLEPIEEIGPDGSVTVEEAYSEWCPNPGCPSNHALRGLERVGVNAYVCKECGAHLVTPMSGVFEHIRAHVT